MPHKFTIIYGLIIPYDSSISVPLLENSII
jgi:hypothetical protein